ncbi:MAG: hypothetical protein E7273_14120 [Pseudobutyrivibrio ruminis]|nr:hypothetical protein [Pseudobutyrivibrio ruminis]
MVLSDERYDALLSGEPPLNEDEEVWLKNYKEFQKKAHLKAKAQEEQYYKDRNSAYREFYLLLKSTIPSSFFYQKPITKTEYNDFEEKCVKKYEPKIIAILSNPILRKINKLPIHSNEDNDYSCISFLEHKFLNLAIYKNFGVGIVDKNVEYDSYLTEDFKQKVRDIGEKYNVYLSYSFEAYDYLTDWQDYNV